MITPTLSHSGPPPLPCLFCSVMRWKCKEFPPGTWELAWEKSEKAGNENFWFLLLIIVGSKCAVRRQMETAAKAGERQPERERGRERWREWKLKRIWADPVCAALIPICFDYKIRGHSWIHRPLVHTTSPTITCERAQIMWGPLAFNETLQNHRSLHLSWTGRVQRETFQTFPLSPVLLRWMGSNSECGHRFADYK